MTNTSIEITTSRPYRGAVLVGLLLLCGCSGELVVGEPGSDQGGVGGAGGSPDAGLVESEPDAAAEGNVAARQYFDSYVQPLLLGVRPKGACALCHQGTNTDNGPILFGTSPDQNYSTLTANGGLVGSSPETSRLLTKGDHAGNAFCAGLGVPYNQCERNEFAILSEWVRLENP
jgi:hypothetical protein